MEVILVAFLVATTVDGLAGWKVNQMIDKAWYAIIRYHES